VQKKVLVAVADGVEEVETLAPIDVLRRAGADVTIAAAGKNLTITASRGVKLIADKLISDCITETYDLIVLPGGQPGAENLRDCKELITLLKLQRDAKRFYAAICASPVVVLQHHGLLDGVGRATCHPALFNQLKNGLQERVVVDQNCITSQGPGTALEFGLKLAELLFNREIADKIRYSMVV
jgi:4-methyl-5(b-hydroxyethyl)-thiazole monophosphate biosynthesis